MSATAPSPSTGDGPTAAEDVRSATVKALSVGLSTSTYGISFGALAVAAGLSVPQAVAMSLLLFSGGSQFAFVGLIGVAPTAAVVSSTLLGLRNGVYSIAVQTMVPMHGPARLAGAHVTIDESTAVALGSTSTAGRRRGFWLTGIVVFLGWNAATLAGAVLGDRLGDPAAWGLDAVAPAAFLALLWPRLHDRLARLVAVAAMAVALVLSPLVPAGLPVLAAGLVAVVVGVAVPTRPAAGG